MLDLVKPNGHFCLQWMLATTLTLALCNPLGAVGLVVGPTVLAIAQSYVLKRHRHRFLSWGLATLVGGYITLLIYLALFLYASTLPLWSIILICGAVLGLAQAVVLRAHSRYWFWWPLINAVILTTSLFWLMPKIMNAAIYGTQRSDWHLLWLVLLTGLIGGTLKGLALDQILHSNR